MTEPHAPSPGHERPIRTLAELREAAQESCVAAHGLYGEAASPRDQLQVMRHITR